MPINHMHLQITVSSSSNLVKSIDYVMLVVNFIVAGHHNQYISVRRPLRASTAAVQLRAIKTGSTTQ